MSRTATTTASPPATLSEFITERFDGFSRSQKDVARYIVDHLDEAAFQTAEELARRASTSSSTVVRFSQALGFEGYPELQQAAIEEYRRAMGGNGTTPLIALDASMVETCLGADHNDVEETIRKVSREDVDSFVAALADAERVVIVGVDQMAFFASYFRHLLALLDIRAEIVASASQEQLSRLARLDDRALAVGLSAGRAHPLVVRAMKLAQRRGAKTLAICDSTLSEVAKQADLSLYYSSNSPSYVRSHTALLSMIQAIAYGVYSRDEAAHKGRIRAFKLK